MEPERELDKELEKERNRELDVLPNRVKKKQDISNIHENKQGDKNENEKQHEQNERNLLTFAEYVDEGEKEKFIIDEKLPESFSGVYIQDYNILHIDDVIKKKLEQDRRKLIDKYVKIIQQENIKIRQTKQNLIERKESRRKIADAQADIKKLENNEIKETYLLGTKEIIRKYAKLKPLNSIVSFKTNSKTEEVKETEEQQLYRHSLISSYLEVARKYITIDLIRKKEESKFCSGCGLNLEEVELEEDEDSGSLYCKGCGLEKLTIVKSAFYSDGSRVNNSKNNYEDRKNFQKAVARYQGKEEDKPPKDLYMKLDEYFISKGMKSSREYAVMPLLPDGTKEGTSKDMMYEALFNIGCSGFYDHINLICAVFFGWLLPDVGHLEEEIMRDYDEFQSGYEMLPDKEGRKSTLNSQWKLYIILKHRNWPCKMREFKVPLTPSILEYHKIKTKEVCNLIGWECPF